MNDKINEIFRKVFNNPTLEINETTTANDVDGWDSISHLSMISAVEKEFDIKFKLKDLMKLKNVGDLQNIINFKLSEKN